MATTDYIFTGTANWAKVLPDRYDVEYECWSLDVVLDEKSLELFKDSGLRLKLKDTENGEKYVRFRRPIKTKDYNTGEIVDATPPRLVDADGVTPWDGREIGNGSKVSVKVEVYDSKKGKGHRLLGVRVDNFVEREGGPDLVAADEVAPF